MTESQTIARTSYVMVGITRAPCPRCVGLGYLHGAYSFGREGCKTISEPTKCHVCRGRGVVKLVPLEDGEK